MKKHYVKFISPGTFMSETTTREIDSWDPKVAVGMAEQIVERYGAKPFGFVFETRLAHEPVSDGAGGFLEVREKVIAKSGVHFLGGTVETYDDVKLRGSRDDETLLSNMRGNDMWICVVNTNSYKTVNAFEADSVVVDAAGNVVAKGDAPERVEYRKRATAERDAEYRRKGWL